jgi:hypothetical protein
MCKENSNRALNHAINRRSTVVSDAIANMNEVMTFLVNRDENSDELTEYELMELDDSENDLRIARESLVLLAELTKNYKSEMFTEDEVELTLELAKVACDIIENNSYSDEG